MDTPPGLFAFYNYICVLASRASSPHLVLATAIPPSQPGGRNKMSDPAFHAQINCVYLSPNRAKNEVTCLHFLNARSGARNLCLLLTQPISLSPKGSCTTSCASDAWPMFLRSCLRQHLLSPSLLCPVTPPIPPFLRPSFLSSLYFMACGRATERS